MDQAEINNWKTIAEKMEASGDTETWFYLRARAIADGKQDPMPTVSELMPKSAWLETMRYWSDWLWTPKGWLFEPEWWGQWGARQLVWAVSPFLGDNSAAKTTWMWDS